MLIIEEGWESVTSLLFASPTILRQAIAVGSSGFSSGEIGKVECLRMG